MAIPPPTSAAVAYREEREAAPATRNQFVNGDRSKSYQRAVRASGAKPLPSTSPTASKRMLPTASVPAAATIDPVQVDSMWSLAMRSAAGPTRWTSMLEASVKNEHDFSMVNMPCGEARYVPAMISP